MTKPFEQWKAELEASLKPEEAEKVSPPHYKRLKPEPIEVIEAWGLGFHSAQVLKYTVRAGYKKGELLIADLKKARFYLDRWIATLEAK